MRPTTPRDRAGFRPPTRPERLSRSRTSPLACFGRRCRIDRASGSRSAIESWTWWRRSRWGVWNCRSDWPRPVTCPSSMASWHSRSKPGVPSARRYRRCFRKAAGWRRTAPCMSGCSGSATKYRCSCRRRSATTPTSMLRSTTPATWDRCSAPTTRCCRTTSGCRSDTMDEPRP